MEELNANDQHQRPLNTATKGLAPTIAVSARPRPRRRRARNPPLTISNGSYPNRDGRGGSDKPLLSYGRAGRYYKDACRGILCRSFIETAGRADPKNAAQVKPGFVVDWNRSLAIIPWEHIESHSWLTLAVDHSSDAFNYEAFCNSLSPRQVLDSKFQRLLV